MTHAPTVHNYHDVLLACLREIGVPVNCHQDGVFYFDRTEIWDHAPELVHRAFVLAKRSVGREPSTFDDWVGCNWLVGSEKCRAWLRHHGYDLDATESA